MRQGPAEEHGSSFALVVPWQAERRDVVLVAAPLAKLPNQQDPAGGGLHRGIGS